MRYTTIIDITQIPNVYRNKHARDLYMYLALKCGYEAHDRDLIRVSIRHIAGTLDMTIKAARHALSVLEQHHLIKREGDLWRVRKYIPGQSIPRRKGQTAEPTAGIDLERLQREADQAKAEQDRRQDEPAPIEGYKAILRAKAAKGDKRAAARLRRLEEPSDMQRQEHHNPRQQGPGQSRMTTGSAHQPREQDKSSHNHTPV